MKTYPIVEIFRSIQGEGLHTGHTAVFVRFGGCNLKCNFGGGFVCDDSAHTDKDKLKYMTAMQIRELVSELFMDGDLVIITGGEPSLQDINPLIAELMPYYVCVETNGYSFSNIRAASFITYSPKDRFSSGENVKITNINIGEIKVLAGVNAPLMPDAYINFYDCFKFVQPISNEHSLDMDNVKYCVDFVLNNPNWRLSLQTHKIYGAR